VCPECGKETRADAGQNFEALIKSLPTNFLALHQEPDEAKQEDAYPTRSLYVKHAEDVKKIKDAYVKPLLPTHIPEESTLCDLLLTILKYIAFTGTASLSLICYIVFVNTLHQNY